MIIKITGNRQHLKQLLAHLFSSLNVDTLDDGLRSGLLDWEQLEGVALWAEARSALPADAKQASERVLRAQPIRALLDHLVTELARESARALEEAGVRSPEGVRRTPRPLVRLPAETAASHRKLNEFLYHALYPHPRVREASGRAEVILGDLYRAYRVEPSSLPAHVVERFGEDGEARAIADYIAGMTDRFALGEHEKLRRHV